MEDQGAEDEDAGLRPRRRLTQAETRERTRRQLLAAAAQVFAKKGFAGASLEEIAELAGYTTGALYYHFANKDQLFVELIRTGWSRQIAGRIDAVTEIFNDDTADPFDTLSAAMIDDASRQRDLAPLSGEFWLYALRNPEAMDLVAEKLREQVDGMGPAVAAAMEKAGTGAGITPEEMTTVAVVLFEGLARRRRMDPSAVPDDLFARVLRRLFAASPPTTAPRHRRGAS